jgi:hypothetical protein
VTSFETVGDLTVDGIDALATLLMALVEDIEDGETADH